MKYMHFNSSCSYASIANLLYLDGIDTEDFVIALAIDLAYLLVKDGASYLAGTMLQSKEIFDIYLNPLGYELIEENYDKDEVLKILESADKNYMLGVNIAQGNKHAIIFKDHKDNRFRFINNKYDDSDEPDEFVWTAEELKERLDDQTHLAHIEKCDVKDVDMEEPLLKSIENLGALKEDIINFSKREISKNELRESMNTLFRAVLLDLETMFILIEEDKLMKRTKKLQKEYINVIKKGKESLVLEKEMNISGLVDVLNEWERLKKNNLKEYRERI